MEIPIICVVKPEFVSKLIYGVLFLFLMVLSKGWWGGSVSYKTCQQAWQPEFDSQDQCDSQSCSLTSTCALWHVCTHVSHTWIVCGKPPLKSKGFMMSHQGSVWLMVIRPWASSLVPWKPEISNNNNKILKSFRQLPPLQNRNMGQGWTDHRKKFE